MRSGACYALADAIEREAERWAATHEPSEQDIESVDTLDAAYWLLADLRSRFKLADKTRAASLAEKIIGAIGRIEQIRARRPAPPPPPDALEALYSREEAAVIDALERHLADRIAAPEVRA